MARSLGLIWGNFVAAFQTLGSLVTNNKYGRTPDTRQLGTNVYNAAKCANFEANHKVASQIEVKFQLRIEYFETQN